MAGFGTLRPVLDGTEQIPGSFAEQPRALPLPVQRTTPGTLRSIAGYIGDALAQSAGMHPVFAAAMERRQAQEDAVRQGVLAQQLALQQWQAQQEYTRTHPAPFRFENNSGDQIEIGPDGQPRTLYHDPVPKTQYITTKDPTTGQTIITPYNPGAVAPSPPVSALPPGYTVRPRGGAAPTAGSPFPR